MTGRASFWRARFADGEPALVAPHYRDRIESSLLALDELELGQALAAAGSDFWTELGAQSTRLRPYSVADGILALPVKGVLLNGFPYQVGAYATGYEYIWRAFERGMADPEVKGIALLIDSPGGMVSGNFDLVDRMFAMRALKPVKAYASDAAYSAAYSIASAASEVIVSRTGGTGSIGVVTAHLDVSRAMEREGFRMTFVYAGKHKIDGNPFSPLSDEAKARIQARVDNLYGIFVDTIARNRGLPPKAIRDTEAGTYGPGESVANRLADRIGSPQTMATDFGARKGFEMNTPTNSAGANTVDGWAAEYRNSPQLQREYLSEASYVAMKKHDARKSGTLENGFSEADAAKQEDPQVAEWMRSPQLQREFITAESYSALKRAEARGGARTFSGRVVTSR